MIERDLYEYPAGYSGRRTYVSVRGHRKSIPHIYTYKGTDGYNYILPEHGGDWSGYENYSRNVSAPMIMRDMGSYVSPLDGATITSRSQHREHMAAHGVIEVGNERMPQASPPPVTPDRDLALTVKRHIDTVKAMPEKEYQSHIERQRAETPRVVE